MSEAVGRPNMEDWAVGPPLKKVCFLSSGMAKIVASRVAANLLLFFGKEFEYFFEKKVQKKVPSRQINTDPATRQETNFFQGWPSN